LDTWSWNRQRSLIALREKLVKIGAAIGTLEVTRVKCALIADQGAKATLCLQFTARSRRLLCQPVRNTIAGPHKTV